MTAKERLRAQVEALSEAEAAFARIVVERIPRDTDGEPVMVGLPKSWQTFEDGTPVPNWVAGLDEARAGR